MRQIKDAAGRTHSLSVNTWALKRLRDTMEIDLLDLGSAGDDKSEALISRLLSDPILIVEIVHCLLAEDLVKASVSERDFFTAMTGDFIDAATQALLDEIVDFFPSPRERARAKKVLAITNAMVDQAQTILDRRVESGEIEQTMQEAIDKTLGSGSISSPESLESIPAD